MYMYSFHFMFFVPVASTVVGIAIYADHLNNRDDVDPGSTTTFVTSAVSALIGGVVLLVSLRSARHA